MDQTLLTLFGQLGIGGIFLWLYIRKDNKMDEKNDKLLEAYKQNSSAMKDLTDAIKKNSEVSDRNLEATDKIYNLLERK